MTTNKLFKLVSTAFRLLIIYLILFVWIRYFSHSFYIALILSLILTIFVDFTLRLISIKKNKKKISREKEQKLIERYNNALIFSEDKEVLDFFYKLALVGHTAEKKSSYILVKSATSNVVLFPFITFRSFSSDDLVYVLNKLKNVSCSKIVICTNIVDDEAKKIAEKIGSKIKILNKEETYFSLMKEYNVFPERQIEFVEKEKLSFASFLSLALNKKRTKSYFFTSIFLLLSSFIVRYNLYYVVMSSVLLVLSFISFTNPKFNKKEINEKILDVN